MDFFAEHVDSPVLKPPTNEPVTEGQRLTQPIGIQNGNGKKEMELADGEGPNVEHALSMSPTEALAKAEPRKALIGAKKSTAKKGGKVCQLIFVWTHILILSELFQSLTLVFADCICYQSCCQNIEPLIKYDIKVSDDISRIHHLW